MGFERAKIEIKQASIGTGIKVSLAKVRGAEAKMKFTVNAGLAKKFGWVNGDKLEILIGNGADHGMMRFRKNNSVGDAEVVNRKSVKGDWVSIALGRQTMFVDRAESARWCQFEELEDGWVEIVLPRWADETGPKKTTQVPAGSTPIRSTTPPPTVKPVVAARSVTGSLMGDPPPGRREIMAKIGEL